MTSLNSEATRGKRKEQRESGKRASTVTLVYLVIHVDLVQGNICVEGFAKHFLEPHIVAIRALKRVIEYEICPQLGPMTMRSLLFLLWKLF